MDNHFSHMASTALILLLVITFTTMPIVYSREKLLDLRPLVKGSRVAKDVYFTLKELNISSVKPTKRGKPSPLKTGSYTNAALWNARSMINKTADVCDFILSEKLDLLTITEAWLKGDSRDDPTIADINNTLPDYNIITHARIGKKGGGICVIYRKGFKATYKSHNFSTFECLEVSLTSGQKNPLKLITIYRPPPNTSNVYTSSKFFEEFSSLLETIDSTTGHFILCGDFNIHVDNENSPDTKTLTDMLDSCAAVQHVHEATHSKGHTLDLVITSEADNFVKNVSVLNTLPSDHSAIRFHVGLARPAPSKKTMSFRKIKNIDFNSFKKDIAGLPIVTDPPTDIDSFTTQYSSELTDLLDKYAPVVTRTITLHPKAPWYNTCLREMKREKRSCERKWRKTKLCSDKLVLHEKTVAYSKALNKAKTVYHQKAIAECDQKQLFKVIESLTVQKSSQSLPSHDSDSDLAKEFCIFFDKKIRNLRLALDSATPSELTVNLSEQCTSAMNCFDLLTTDDVLTIIKGSSIKSCSLDPLPASVFKNVIPDLLPTITNIVNKSLQSGIFPADLKKAIVLPLLKKANLDPEIKKNYRPISNLAFLGKTIERAAIKQFVEYLSKNDLFARSQSAYRQFHSTETALLRVSDDILRTLDQQGGEVILVLLDLTAAFDTIDHNLLLQRLQMRYGIGGVVLKWFSSYLKQREQSVMINSSLSDP